MHSLRRAGLPGSFNLPKTITDVPFAYATSEATSAQSPSAQARARCEARLAYDDEKTALEFLTKAFGLHEQTRMQGPDDSLMAWLEFGRSALMIGRSGPEHTTSTGLVRPASPRPR
jgi:hypothetical protein